MSTKTARRAKCGTETLLVGTQLNTQITGKFLAKTIVILNHRFYGRVHRFYYIQNFTPYANFDQFQP